MTPLAPIDHHTIDIGSPTWCWNHLNDTFEGILSYRTSRGPIIALAVTYTVAGQQIAIPVTSSRDTAWLAADGEATLEVTGRNDGGALWVVRASGQVTRTQAPSPPNQELSQLVLPAVRVRGFYETSLDSPTEPLRSDQP
jgi:hypothetical protein